MARLGLRVPQKVSRSWIFALLVVSAIAVAVAYRGIAEQKPRGAGLARLGGGSGGEVHGIVVADAQELTRTSRFPLPDITAYLRDTTTGVESPRVTTDLKGFFMIPSQPAGSYALCVEADGYVANCTQQVVIGSEMVFLPNVPIAPKRGYISGRVGLQDGRPCFFDDPSFGVSFDTRVRVSSGGKVLADGVRANITGRYLVPNLPAGSMEVRANCEEAMDTRVVSLPGSGTGVADFVLANQPPSLVTVIARAGGKAVRRAAPGTILDITAASQDADGLHYSWVVSGSSQPFTSVDGDHVSWTVPQTKGIHSIYVLVTDRRGGVSLGRRDISTDESSLLFSGTVHDTAGTVADAPVQIVGIDEGDVSGAVLGETRTNAAGHFSIALPKEKARYVLTIDKQGYQIYSQVFQAPTIGRRYDLVAAQRFTFDAERGGELVERGEGNCSTKSNTFTNPELERMTLEQRLELWRRQPRCGAQVIIGAETLVDAEGRPATGEVTAFISSIDLRSGIQFPGEYGGITTGGNNVGLNSVGAVDVTFVDAGGGKLQLASGSTATVRIGVDPLQLGVPGMPGLPPATVPIWFYDASSGLWNQEGTGKLAGDFYEAEVKHFSTINADLEFTTPACMRIHTDTSKIAIPYQLRMSVPAVNPVKVKTETIDDSLSVAIRLPENTPVKFEALDSAGNVISISTVVQSTGVTSQPAQPTLDYGTCTSDVTITLDLPSQGGALDYFGPSLPEDADSYYAKIDPVAANGAGTVSSAGTTVTGSGTSFVGFIEPGQVLRAGTQVRLVSAVTNNTTLVTESAFNPPLPAGTTWEKVGVKHTLAAWKAANGFGADDYDAVYLNKPDLGLGRWMHMKKTGNNSAYYVSNYGVPPNFGSADLAAFAKLSNDPSIGLIATVAMEYSPHPTININDRYTKFYVFNAAGVRVNGADLDGNGVKYLPNLCIICHGGQPATTAADNRGNGLSRFIAFDPESLGYSGLDDPNNPGGFTLAGQETEFKEMNRNIRDDTNVSAALQELIEGWYGGVLLPSATQIPTYVHKGWRLNGTGTPPGTSPVDKAQLYRDVIRPSCRTCHNTRDNQLSWDTWDGPGLKTGFPYYAVCDGRYMPHAKVTFNRFWLSTTPHQPAALGNGGIDGWLPTDPCPAP